MVRMGICCVVAAALLCGCGGSRSSGPPVLLSNYIAPGDYRVPSGSMEPTLKVGERVAVNSKKAPAVGEVVVFNPPRGAELELCGASHGMVKPGGRPCATNIDQKDSVKFVKRIVAGPGDRLYVRGGHVFREAAGEKHYQRESDSYIKPCGPGPRCDFPTPIEVPAGEWYMLGDNRGESDDSRFWGPVPTAWIVGVVTAIDWPPQRRAQLPSA